MPSVLSLLTALSALLTMSQVLALPNNASIETSSIETSSIETSLIETSSIPDRYSKSYCSWWGEKGGWEIYSKGWGRNDGHGECGSIILGSLRGCTEPIQHWGCKNPPPVANDDEHGSIITFRLGRPFNGRYARCVERAFRLGSENVGGKDTVRCRNVDHDE